MRRICRSRPRPSPSPIFPFFFVIDDRVTYSYIFTGTDPGAFSAKNGGINGKTAKSVYSFTHFDAWAYGTNFFTISMFKSDQNDPAIPCTNAGAADHGRSRRPAPARPNSTACSAARSAGTRSSTPSFQLSVRCITSRSRSAPTATRKTASSPRRNATSSPVCNSPSTCPTKATSTSLPLAYKEINHNAFDQCGLFGPGTPWRDLHRRRQHRFQDHLGS